MPTDPDRQAPRRRRHQLVPVGALAAKGDEERPVSRVPRVSDDEGHDGVVTSEHPAYGDGDLRERPRDPPDLPSARISSAAPSRSSNAIVRSASSWYASCPLPAITTTSPGPASDTEMRMAARRSTSTT